MLKKTAIYLCLFLALFLFNFFIQAKLAAKINRENAMNQVLAEIEEGNNIVNQFSHSSSPFNTGRFQTDVKTADGRAANLKVFFRKHGSILYDYADLIVQESDDKHFDYRLMAAIAMQESTLCRAIPPGSHNCWGWGIYGDTVTKFNSYEDAIRTVAEGIKEEYLDKGLTTATKIMAKYTPSSPEGAWAKSVNHFLKALE